RRGDTGQQLAGGGHWTHDCQAFDTPGRIGSRMRETTNGTDIGSEPSDQQRNDHWMRINCPCMLSGPRGKTTDHCLSSLADSPVHFSEATTSESLVPFPSVSHRNSRWIARGGLASDQRTCAWSVSPGA
ncbi:MAG: hypothetical protein ACK53L_33145, partial [Pirellulaceae bacterium]